MLTFFGWLYKVFAVTIIFFICVLTRGTLYNVRADEITNDFFYEVKASDTAPYTQNQKNGYKLLQRNGGMIRGKGKDGFLGGTILGPLKGYTTRNGITRSILDDMNLIGGN